MFTLIQYSKHSTLIKKSKHSQKPVIYSAKSKVQQLEKQLAMVKAQERKVHTTDQQDLTDTLSLELLSFLNKSRHMLHTVTDPNNNYQNKIHITSV